MNKKLSIDTIKKTPRILNIQLEIENNKVINATTNSLMYEPFQKIFETNLPLNLMYFNKKSYKLYPNENFLASTLAIEDCLNLTVNSYSKKARDFILGCKFIKSHIKNFYLYTLPDFVKLPNVSPLNSVNHNDFRLTKKLTRKMYTDYLLSIKYIRLINVFFNLLVIDSSHNFSIFLGGSSIDMFAFHTTLKSIIQKLKYFINNIMLEDVTFLSQYYADYFKNGIGYPNLMSYGCFSYKEDAELNYVNPKIFVNGCFDELNSNLITENVYYSFNKKFNTSNTKKNKDSFECLKKFDTNYWIKIPRYSKYPMEVGPLARMILSNNYKNKISTMDRIYARVLEAKKIIEKMDVLLKTIQPSKKIHSFYKIPLNCFGRGLIDTPKGSLGHWISISNKNIQNYNIISSSSWNLSTKDSFGTKGVLEKALIGTELNDINHPIEILRIIHSFDPFISCNVNIIKSSKEPVYSFIL